MTNTNILDFPSPVKAKRRKSTPRPLLWYKRYPADFQEGTRHLSPAARGIYSDILDLIYMRGGPVPDDPMWMRSKLHIHDWQWRRLRKELLVAGKLIAVDGMISNPRAQEELEERASKIDSKAPKARKPANTIPDRVRTADRTESGQLNGTFLNEINGRDSQNQNHHQSQTLREEKNHHLDAAREDDDPHGKRKKLNPQIAAKLTEIVGTQEAKHILSAYFRSVYARDAKIVDKAFPRWVEATYGHRIAEGMTLKQFNAEIRAMCQDENGNIDIRLPKTPPRVREKTP